MAKELTLEEALAQITALQKENTELKEAAKVNDASLKSAVEAAIKDSEEEILKLKEALKEKESEVSKLNNEVPGTFIDKETKKVYKFKKGFLQFKRNGKQLISEEVIKDAKLMKDLVEDGFGGIEEVKSNK